MSDESINANQLTWVPNTWSEGRQGPVPLFDGVDDYMAVSNSPVLDMTGAMTIVLWWNIARDTFTFSVIVSKSDAGTTEGYLFRTRHVATVPQLEFRTQANNHQVVCSELVKNTWHHIGVVYDGINIEYFVNGASKGYAPSPNRPTTTEHVFEVGRLTGSNQWFKGMLADLRIYKRALEPHEIEAIYRATV